MNYFEIELLRTLDDAQRSKSSSKPHHSATAGAEPVKAGALAHRRTARHAGRAAARSAHPSRPSHT